MRRFHRNILGMSTDRHVMAFLGITLQKDPAFYICKWYEFHKLESANMAKDVYLLSSSSEPQVHTTEI